MGLFQLLQPGDHHESLRELKSCWWLVHISPSPQPQLCQSRDADFRQFEVLAAGEGVSILFDSAFAVLICDYLISFVVLWSSPLERSWVPYKCGRSWQFFSFFLQISSEIFSYCGAFKSKAPNLNTQKWGNMYARQKCKEVKYLIFDLKTCQSNSSDLTSVWTWV